MRNWLVKFVLLVFIGTEFLPSFVYAAPPSVLNLPPAGMRVALSPAYSPVLLKGIKIHPQEPFKFDFVVDTGRAADQTVKSESQKMIKYFLAALTIPEQDLWVNLSPYEKDRIAPNGLSLTELGRDMLAQDYLLKQIMASLLYPEEGIGKEFWARVYQKAQALYGTTGIPVDTFNKVWILPGSATVYEQGTTAYIKNSRLKVMLDEDYLALNKNGKNNPTRAVSSQIVRDIVLPALEKEVNEGRNFAAVRQIYQAVILAAWFKRNLKNSVLGKSYVGQDKINGIDLADKNVKQRIYQQYLKAYRMGVYNYIRDEYDPVSKANVARKYFSGGLVLDRAHLAEAIEFRRPFGQAMDGLPGEHTVLVSGSFDPEMKRARHTYYRKTVLKLSKSKKHTESVLRISEIFTLPLQSKEIQTILDKIRQRPDIPIVLLNKETLNRARHGDVSLTLNDSMGIIPKSYLGRTVTLGGNAAEILKGYESDSMSEVMTSVLHQPSLVMVKVGGFFRIKVRFGTRFKVRDLFLLSFNHTKMMDGVLKITPIGGGARFTDKTRYKDIPMIPAEDDYMQMRQYIAPEDLPDFVQRILAVDGRDPDPRSELIEELIGADSEIKLFSKMPKKWRSAGRQENGGIDMDSNLVDIQRQGPGGTAFDFGPAVQSGEAQFSGLKLRIDRISPITDLPAFFAWKPLPPS